MSTLRELQSAVITACVNRQTSSPGSVDEVTLVGEGVKPLRENKTFRSEGNPCQKKKKRKYATDSCSDSSGYILDFTKTIEKIGKHSYSNTITNC